MRLDAMRVQITHATLVNFISVQKITDWSSFGEAAFAGVVRQRSESFQTQPFNLATRPLIQSKAA